MSEVTLTTWVKADGTEIELNDNPGTVEAARRNGWKRKRGRPKGSVNTSNTDDESMPEDM